MNGVPGIGVGGVPGIDIPRVGVLGNGEEDRSAPDAAVSGTFTFTTSLYAKKLTHKRKSAKILSSAKNWAGTELNFITKNFVVKLWKGIPNFAMV